MADLEIQLSEIKIKAKRAKIKVNEQDALVKNLVEKAMNNKQKSKECIVKLFAELEELLHKKRTELLAKEHDAYLSIETTLSACTRSIHIGLRAVTELLDDAEVEAGRHGPIERLRLMTTVINDEIAKCERLVEDVQIPEVFVANSTVKDVIGGLQYGETESVEGADRFVDSVDRNENTSENEASDNNADRVNSVNDDIPPESDTIVASSDDITHETESSDTPDNSPNLPEPADENSVVPYVPVYGGVEGAEAWPLYVALDNTDPEEPPPPYWPTYGAVEEVESAPLNVALEDTDTTEPPPSYWQAIGLSLPVNESSDDLPPRRRVQRTIVDRELHLDKSFKVWKGNEKLPMLISLSWKYNRLCFADKSNRSLKFYDATGKQIAKMSFSGEIGDAAFLNAEAEVENYIVTFPKDYMIAVVCIDSHGILKLEKRIRVKDKFTSICKGPILYTFIGGVSEPRLGSPKVELCNFSGNVIQLVAYSREYNLFTNPSSVAIFKHFAVFADREMNFVSVYSAQNDCSLRSTYKGAFGTQLLHPCDLEIDEYGNILILEGERRKIHVINLDSELIALLEIPAFGLPTSVPRSLALENEMMHRFSPRLAVTSGDGFLGLFHISGGYQKLVGERPSRAEHQGNANSTADSNFKETAI